jgi:Rps23 Pro-64 3,4-dihydroxylase Tpa1-like proline 4-hydroxylase
MKMELINLLVNRLTEERERLKIDFNRSHDISIARHFTLDNVLPIDIAQRIYANFPDPKKMHLLKSGGRIKLKYSHLRDTSILMQDINAAIQSLEVVKIIEEITGIRNQIPDPTRFAGGISTLLKSYFINPHVDNSHDVELKKYYRTVNVLYYVSPDWKLENGGNFELWDQEIKRYIVVPSLFNRLLVMETNRTSWHAVSPVVCHQPRCCVFNYYFSKQSPEGIDYFFDAPSFKPRPEQKIRRAIFNIKSKLLKNLQLKK